MSMFDRDTWQEIVSTLGKNRLRTALTACGVFWGIFMLVIMLGFGHGLETGVKKDMGGFATNAVYVWGERTSLPFKGLPPGRDVSFTNDDIAAIRERVDGIEHLAPRNQLGGWMGGDNVTRGRKTGSFSVNGDMPDFQYVQPMRFDRGRFINALDIEQRRKVAVLGNRAIRALYEEGEDPIGTHIQIQGVYFTVVGTFQTTQSGEMAERQGNTIFIPFTTFQRAFNYGDRVGWFAVTARSDASAAQVETDVRAVVAERQRIDPEDSQALGSFNAGKEFKKIGNIFGGINFLVWFVGVITLLAGVIGVSNIMLIIVKERTKEIGIRKAVGATPAAIMAQIIQESTLLTAIAGYIGLTAGVAALELVGAAMGDGSSGMFARPEVDLRIALIATAILVVSGAVAGIMPARHAVRINPVEALRAEG